MPASPPQLTLGYFARFMVAYGEASEVVRHELASLEQHWASRLLSDEVYVLEVSRALGIDPPVVIT